MSRLLTENEAGFDAKRVPSRTLSAGQGKLDFDRPLSLAARVLGMGCDAGSGAACAEGGALFLKEAGLFKRSDESPGATEPVPLEQPLARAASLLDRGCRGGDTVDNAKSCGLLGALMLHERCVRARCMRLCAHAVTALFEDAGRR